MAAKRFLEDATADPMKKIKNNDPEGSWICPFCNNVNWPKRTTCNKEGCHMPKDLGGNQHPEGSWACTSCNNINWPKRTECNKCKTPRAGANLGLQGAQPGSWICPTCANLNFPARTMCNKGCGTAKPPTAYGAPMGQQLNQLSQMAGLNLEPYLQSLLASTNPYLSAAPSGVPGPGPGTAGAHPPGSWTCPTCNNVNWPKRTMCNKPDCRQPRPGLTMEQAIQMNQTHPEGSWVCTSCNNVNWPQRTECNKCHLPRTV